MPRLLGTRAPQPSAALCDPRRDCLYTAMYEIVPHPPFAPCLTPTFMDTMNACTISQASGVVAKATVLRLDSGQTLQRGVVGGAHCIGRLCPMTPPKHVSVMGGTDASMLLPSFPLFPHTMGSYSCGFTFWMTKMAVQRMTATWARRAWTRLCLRGKGSGHTKCTDLHHTTCPIAYEPLRDPFVSKIFWGSRRGLVWKR